MGENHHGNAIKQTKLKCCSANCVKNTSVTRHPLTQTNPTRQPQASTCSS